MTCSKSHRWLQGRQSRKRVGPRRASGGKLFSQSGQIVVAVKTGAMTVAKIETHGVVSHAFPAQDLYSGKIDPIAPARAMAQNVRFAALIGAGRSCAEFVHGKIALGAVGPRDGDFLADELDVARSFQTYNGKQLAWLWQARQFQSRRLGQVVEKKTDIGESPL